jgi:predicted nucleic acid-binding protein
MGKPSVTTAEAAFAKTAALGIDTAPFIYFVERHPVYLTVIRDIFRRIDQGFMRGCASVITLTEVLVQPKRCGKIALEKEYCDLLLRSRNFDLIPIDAEVAELAAELRGRHNLRTPDALQIAASLSAGCETFLTNDKQLKRVDELTVLTLDDFV